MKSQPLWFVWPISTFGSLKIIANISHSLAFSRWRDGDGNRTHTHTHIRTCFSTLVSLPFHFVRKIVCCTVHTLTLWNWVLHGQFTESCYIHYIFILLFFIIYLSFSPALSFFTFFFARQMAGILRSTCA